VPQPLRLSDAVLLPQRRTALRLRCAQLRARKGRHQRELDDEEEQRERRRRTHWALSGRLPSSDAAKNSCCSLWAARMSTMAPLPGNWERMRSRIKTPSSNAVSLVKVVRRSASAVVSADSSQVPDMVVSGGGGQEGERERGRVGSGTKSFLSLSSSLACARDLLVTLSQCRRKIADSPGERDETRLTSSPSTLKLPSHACTSSSSANTMH